MRIATHEDFEEVTDMVLEFNRRHYDKPINPEKWCDWYDLHMRTGVVMLGDGAFISGLVTSDPVRTWDVLAETGWYSTKGREGLRLLHKFIRYARDRDLDEVRMSTLNNTPETALTLLSRLGFEEIERSHRLVL